MPPAQRVDRVSAVVCNYNGETYLEECLRSILAQEGVDEVLVVDNASTDGSVALVEERFPEVRVVALDRNNGPCEARNVGMREARNRWVLAVDNDAVLRPDVLTKLRAALDEDSARVIAQPRSVVYDDPERVHYDAGDFHYVGLLALRNFYRPLREAEGEGVVPTNALIGMSPLVDREALLGCGGYDEAYFYLAEDFDLALRLRQMGHEIVSVADAIVLHKGGTQGLSFRGGGYPGQRAYLHSRNRWYLMAKCYSVRTLVAVLPGLLVYELVWLLFTVMKGHLGAHVRGKLAFLRMLPLALRNRREVQRLRQLPDRGLLVGGPLTFSPSLLESGPARLATRVLDAILRGWWTVGRVISG